MGGNPKGSIVCCHYQIDVHLILPENGRCKMDGIEGAEFSWHRLCGSIEHDRVDFDKFERPDQREDRSPPCR